MGRITLNAKTQDEMSQYDDIAFEINYISNLNEIDIKNANGDNLRFKNAEQIQEMIDSSTSNFVTESEVTTALNQAISNIPSEINFEIQDTLYQSGAEVTVVTGEHTHYLVDTTEFIGHVDSDQARWQTTLDAQVAQEARLKQWCQDLILGSTPILDYGNPTLVMGAGGLVNLLDGQEWTAPYNGAIVCSSGGLLSVAYSVLVNGVSVWESPIYLLGAKIGGDDTPSTEIPISSGDVVTASGLLSLGSPINVTFYKNKA